MIRIDTHMHTKRCGHATGEVADYIAEGKRKGLREIGFSDHLPFVTPRDPHYTMDLSELPDYHRDIEEARDSHKDLRIKIGIEADYMEGKSAEIKKLISEAPQGPGGRGRRRGTVLWSSFPLPPLDRLLLVS